MKPVLIFFEPRVFGETQNCARAKASILTGFMRPFLLSFYFENPFLRSDLRKFKEIRQCSSTPYQNRNFRDA